MTNTKRYVILYTVPKGTENFYKGFDIMKEKITNALTILEDAVERIKKTGLFARILDENAIEVKQGIYEDWQIEWRVETAFNCGIDWIYGYDDSCKILGTINDPDITIYVI